MRVDRAAGWIGVCPEDCIGLAAHKNPIIHRLWISKGGREAPRGIAQSRVELLHCGDRTLTDLLILKVSEENQMLIWLCRNLDLPGRGQYGPRGF
jgi:hypothetical protein